MRKRTVISTLSLFLLSSCALSHRSIDIDYFLYDTRYYVKKDRSLVLVSKEKGGGYGIIKEDDNCSPNFILLLSWKYVIFKTRINYLK